MLRIPTKFFGDRECDADSIYTFPAGLPGFEDQHSFCFLTMPGAEPLIATMRRSGATCALVSGGFTFFTERIAGRLGFDAQQANTLEVADGRISGTVADPILGREAKRAALQRLAQDRGVNRISPEH